MKRSLVEAVAIATADGLILTGNFQKAEEADAVAAFVSLIARSVVQTCTAALNEQLLSFHLTTFSYGLEITQGPDLGLLIIKNEIVNRTNVRIKFILLILLRF
jgi:hypothetical protein